MNLVSFGYNYSFLLQAFNALWLASHYLLLASPQCNSPARLKTNSAHYIFFLVALVYYW